jgi:general secretion pathway protein L
VLRLPADKVLSKKISLPIAAEANLRQVVGFEIDRLTPFSPGQVYYDVRIMERQPAARRIQVEFIVVPCSIVDPLLKRFFEIGLPPDRVDVAGINYAFNLLPEEKLPPKNRATQRIQLALIALALALVMAASALPLWQQRHLVVTLLPKVGAAQVKAEQVFALREELEGSIESSRFLLQKKQEAPLVIQILNELTVVLPDNTWIERLEIKDNTLQIRGQSLEASALIGLVEASEFFHGVTFLSPVTADRRTGRDRFFLSAQISRES